MRPYQIAAAERILSRIVVSTNYKKMGTTAAGGYIWHTTGTGKTYVYTQTIFELHKNYGFNKFIIVVPSLAIKAGTQKFITSSYVKHHFRETQRYHCEIDLHVLEAKKAKGKISSFRCSGICQWL